MRSPTAVLIPVRSFREGKSRLASSLPEAQRQALLRDMADTVLTATGHLTAAVVTRDADVAAWAGQAGALVLDEHGRHLSIIVRSAVDELGAAGFGRAIIAHADLPLADDLTWLAEPTLPDVVVVTDRRTDGSNVVMVPTGADFHFAYGPSSWSRHQAEARRLGLGVTVVRDPLLGWDVDVVDDLALPTGKELSAATRASRTARAQAATALQPAR